MEPERTEGKTMRQHKHNAGVSDRWVFLTPMVNSCKLHLTSVKSLVPEKAQRMVDSQDPIRDRNMNTTQTMNHLNPENRFHAGSQRRLVQTPPLPSCSSDSTDSSAHNLVPRAGGAQSGLDAFGRPSNLSAGATYHCHALDLPKPAGGSGGYKNKVVPGFPFTQLPCDTSASSFQRIDLDRRCLEECPQLDFMDELQFLNLQHNLITVIQHLSHLQQLVFLNLCDNHISEMTGIEALSSLRILMLGKNRIHKIRCLEGLSRLNLLDLHENQISRIENMSHLSELRVLNLAGNRISRVENLQGLDCLTELNLRHNCISVVVRGLFLISDSLKHFIQCVLPIVLFHIKEKAPTVHGEPNLIFTED